MNRRQTRATRTRGQSARAHVTVPAILLCHHRFLSHQPRVRHSAHGGDIEDHTRLLPKPRANRDGAATRFHRFSMAAWMIQLIPYFWGMLTGTPIIDLSANEAFYPALIGASIIGLTLHLHGNARRTQSNKLFTEDTLQNTH